MTGSPQHAGSQDTHPQVELDDVSINDWSLQVKLHTPEVEYGRLCSETENSFVRVQGALETWGAGSECESLIDHQVAVASALHHTPPLPIPPC